MPKLTIEQLREWNRGYGLYMEHELYESCASDIERMGWRAAKQHEEQWLRIESRRLAVEQRIQVV